MPKRIFLSYGHDRYADDVLLIKADLEARGHEVWFDVERLRAGIDWDAYIENGLRWCDKVVLAMTPHSVRRRRVNDAHSSDGFCLNEIAKAIQLNKPIIPIELAHLDDGPPTSICRLQFIDMKDCVPVAERRARYDVRVIQLIKAIEDGVLDTGGGQGRLRRYLRPLDFDSEMSRHITRFEGRRWLLDSLNTWLSDCDSRAFWLVGGPGIGKTAFATHLCHSRGDVIACHFCTHGHADKIDARRAVLSLIYQLCSYLPDYARAVGDLPLEDEHEKNAQTLLDNLLIEPLSRLYGRGTVPAPDTPKLVVIDGLDEATDSDQRNEIAALVGRSWTRTPAWLRLVVTSRPETEVVAPLQMIQTLHPVVVHAESEENLRDAEAFIESELAGMGLGVEGATVETLLTLSEGNFLYLTVVLDEIRHGRMRLDRLRAFPRGMAGYYQQYFERRFGNPAEYRDRFRPIVAPIIAQREPLPLEMLAGATQLDRFAVDDALSLLGSLFPLHSHASSGSMVVTILHKSLRDWLTGRDELTGRLTAGPYAVDLDAGESRLAEACWGQYLLGLSAMSAYAMRHLLDHLSATGRLDDLESVLRNATYVRARNAALVAAPPIPQPRRPPRPDPNAIEIGRLEQHLRSAPQDFHSRFSLGVLYALTGEWRKAITTLEDAAKLNPGEWRTHSNLSLAFSELRDFERALAAARRAAELAREAPIFVALGAALEGLGKPEEAAKAYAEGLRIDPLHADLVLTLGNLYGKMGELDKAIEHYAKILSIDPANLHALSNISYIYEEKGDQDTALGYLKRATEVRPDDPIAWYDLGSAYVKMNALPEAVACFRRSYDLDQRHYKACLSLALALEDSGELGEGVEYYARAMSLTDDAKLRDALAETLVRALQIDSSLAPTFEPAAALEYARLWVQINRSRNRGNKAA